MGGRWLTSAEALERFAAAQTPSVAGDGQDGPRGQGTRETAAERAGKELEKAGA